MKSSISDIHSFKKGQIVSGIVENIKSYGAFVKVNDSDISGIVYKEDISPIFINNPEDKIKVGDSVNFLVKKYDSSTGRLVLTNKINNFSDMVKEINTGDVVEGIVRNQYKSGVFIEIMQDLVGFADYKFALSYGEYVKVCVKSIDEKKQRIKLEILG